MWGEMRVRGAAWGLKHEGVVEQVMLGADRGEEEVVGHNAVDIRGAREKGQSGQRLEAEIKDLRILSCNST